MASATSIPPRVRQAKLTAEQIFERTKVRELQLSRLLMFYISGGLLFMLLPGTFLGVWNLISISGRRAAEGTSPAWIQAHGHAQVMGWIGSFILGIGYYSIPKLRQGGRPFALSLAWSSGVLWMAGVSLRWVANVYLWHWRALLPISAAICWQPSLLRFSLRRYAPRRRKACIPAFLSSYGAPTSGLALSLLECKRAAASKPQR